MSLTDLGKNDVSEETQALKDKLASRDTECAGLRTQLMRREAELEELQATLNDTVYKLSKEAHRALQLEEEVSTRSSELKTERIALRNTELALQSTQGKFKVEERAKRELESTLDTFSLRSQTTNAEHQSVQREKRALESRVRELERMVQTHESRRASNIPHKGGRPRSSSVSNFRLPAVEQELSDTKAQLHTKEITLRALELKLTQAQDDLVKAENVRISIDKASQKRISELLSTVEKKEEELEFLREADHAGEREEELLKRIDEDATKIETLEKLVAESQAARTSQARVQKLQSQLKAECEKVQRSEDIQDRLLHEKEELIRQCEASQRKIHEDRELLAAREYQIKELEAKHANILAGVNSYNSRKESSPQTQNLWSQRPSGVAAFPNESALADHIQTLLEAIDRLRDERDGLKRALEFSEVEYRITTEGFQTHVASLTSQLTSTTRVAANKPSVDAYVGTRMKELTSCAAAFGVVISHLQTQLDLSADRLSATTADLTISNSQLHDALVVVNDQKQLLVTNTHQHDDLLHKIDATTMELSKSNEECGRLRLQLADVEKRAASMVERIEISEAAREEAHERLHLTEQQLAGLNENFQDMESERNAFALQLANLQDDLAHLQDELADAQNRYNTLHAQQLSEMSTSEAVDALKDRIQELEDRIVHYTGQICDYQHDIRRLEANIKLHEGRIAEMTPELELLASQKETMVEDCAEARRARDEALGRLEAAEEDAERLQHWLQQAKHDHNMELSAMSLMVEKLTSENQQAAIRQADLEAKNAGFNRELDTLNHDHQRLGEDLGRVASCSRSLQLETSAANAETQQAVVSFAIIHRAYKDSVRQLQISYQHLTTLNSQLATLTQALEQQSALVDREKKEKLELLQQLCDVREEAHRSRRDHGDIDLYNALQEKEQELANTRQLFEETKCRYSETETKLLERIATMTTDLQARERQEEDIANLQEELENVKSQLQSSQENFADLAKLHSDVMHEFTTVRGVLERRLAETDEQIRSLDADHQQGLSAVEAKYQHETDVLASSLEDREQEMDELRQQFQEVSEAYTCAEGKLRSEITSLQAEIQRSASLTRYLENQAKEGEDACMLLKEKLQQSEQNLAEVEKATKSAEFNFTLQTTQHEKVVAALRREIVSLQSRPELHSAFAELEEKNQVMDDLLRAKCQEIEEYDDRILETLKANKKLTSKVESLTRKVQALQVKISSTKSQSPELVPEVIPTKKAPSPTPNPSVSPSATTHARSHLGSGLIRESSALSLTLRSKTPEPQTELRPQTAAVPPSSQTPNRPGELSGCEMSAGKKRPAPDDDERDSVPAEGHYSTDESHRNGPTPRLRRAHGHPAGFTPVRGASSRKAAGLSSPGHRVVNVGITPSEIITDVTNSPRGISRQGDTQMMKKSWLGKIRGGAGPQPLSSRLGSFGRQ